MIHELPDNVIDYLNIAATRYSDKTFIRCTKTNTVLTYKEVNDISSRLAEILRLDLGLSTGDIVFIKLPNSIDIPILMFALIKAGAVFSILHEDIKHSGLMKLVKIAKPKAIFTKYNDGLETCLKNIDIISVSKTGTIRINNQVSNIRNVVCESNIKHELYISDSNTEVAGIIFTSGTTKNPKGIRITHKNICFTSYAIQKRLEYVASDKIGVFLPLSFDYGLYQVFLAMASGCSVLLGDPKDVGPHFVSLLNEHQISVLPAVPTMVVALNLLLERFNVELSFLRLLTNTGEHLSAPKIKKLISHLPNIKIALMYGLTECKRVTILDPEKINLFPNSVGTPLPGISIKVVDQSGKTVKPGEIGELVVSGPNVTSGYLNSPQATKKTFVKNLQTGNVELFTGDLCRIDIYGNLYVLGRRDTILKCKGHRLSAAEIEGVACEMAEIVDAAVIVENEDDTLHMYVAVRDNSVSINAIVKHMRGHLEGFKVPDIIHKYHALPKTVNGKVDRKTLAHWINTRGEAVVG